MAILKKIAGRFRSEGDIWMFYAFLLSLPLSVRKIIYISPFHGSFNEYTSAYIYLSDILLISVLFIFILNNISSFLSTLILYCRRPYEKSLFTSGLKMFHVEHFRGIAKFKCSTWNIFSRKFSLNVDFFHDYDIWLLLAGLVLISFFSFIWAEDKNLAIFRSLKLLEFSALAFYVFGRIVPRGTFLKLMILILIITGVGNSLIAIFQFLIQHSVGLFWLKESFISPNVPGVAKLIFGSDRIIRSYGLFPHPNILGGFLMITTLLTFAYRRMFHVEHKSGAIVPRGTIFTIISNPSFHNLVPLKMWLNRLIFKFLPLFIGLQITALLMAFSKSAIIGLVLATGYVILRKSHFHNREPEVNCSTWNNNSCAVYDPVRHRDDFRFFGKMFHVEHLARRIILIGGIVLTLGIIFKPNINSLLFNSLKERLFYLGVSRETIISSPIIGVGSGQSVLAITENVPRGTIIADWQYQPVHNIFLLIWSELGIVGLSILVWLLWKLFHVEQLGAKSSTRCSTWNNNQCEVYTPTTLRRNATQLGDAFLGKRYFAVSIKGLLIGLLFIGFFDHYLWDIQQGQLLLGLTIGLAAGWKDYLTI